MRDINRIIIHCSATRPDQDIGVEEIREWHIKKGWRDIGYHYLIRRNGEVENGRPVEQAGAHAHGHNADTIGVCLIGGINRIERPDANFTFQQYKSLTSILEDLKAVYNICNDNILGHRDLPDVRKACPCFDVQSYIC